MEEKLALLEKLVTNLEKIVYKEKVVIPDPVVREEDKINPDLIKMMKEKNLWEFSGVRRVPEDYYTGELEYRKQCLGCQKIDQLCKCVLFEARDCPDPLKKFICVVVQYVDKVDSGKLQAVVSQALGTKVSDISLANEAEAIQLTGSEHNAMTPVFMVPTEEYKKYKVTNILSQKIAAIDPTFFWLGGGEVDVKYGIETRKFITTFKPIVADISAK
jgi:hypothetical protein